MVHMVVWVFDGMLSSIGVFWYSLVSGGICSYVGMSVGISGWYLKHMCY